MITTRDVPGVGLVKFTSRARMQSRRFLSLSRVPQHWPVAPSTVNWYGSLNFPIDRNDTLGICGLAMAAHGDNTFTGNNGAESTFDLVAMAGQYLAVSGGDNGLTQEDVVDKIWRVGVAHDPKAIIYDALDFDPDPAAIASATNLFGCVCLGMSLPDAWINAFDPRGGTVWDAGTANPMNGHYTLINGVNPLQQDRVQTWGAWTWLTPRGLKVCDASVFTVFSPRWFNPATGLAPNGKGYDELAALWVELGGRKLPPNPFVSVPPVVTPPPPPPDYKTWQQFTVFGRQTLVWLDGTTPPWNGSVTKYIPIGGLKLRVTAR